MILPFWLFFVLFCFFALFFYFCVVLLSIYVMLQCFPRLSPRRYPFLFQNLVPHLALFFHTGCKLVSSIAGRFGSMFCFFSFLKRDKLMMCCRNRLYTYVIFTHHLSPCSSMFRASHWSSEGYRLYTYITFALPSQSM